MRDYPKSQDLLDWYDRHARVMPWRVAPVDRAKGVESDPYRIWMSEIMLQQTTVAAVKAYFVKFTTLWPTVQDLAASEDADVMHFFVLIVYLVQLSSPHLYRDELSMEA